MKTLAQHQFGDFQTPVDLACEVTRFLRTSGVSPSAVIEPTCGVGNFLVASMRAFGSAFASALLQQFLCVRHQRSSCVDAVVFYRFVEEADVFGVLRAGQVFDQQAQVACIVCFVSG